MSRDKMQTSGGSSSSSSSSPVTAASNSVGTIENASEFFSFCFKFCVLDRVGSFKTIVRVEHTYTACLNTVPGFGNSR